MDGLTMTLAMMVVMAILAVIYVFGSTNTSQTATGCTSLSATGPGKKAAYETWRQAALEVEERKGVLAGIRFMRKNGTPGDYLTYLLDRAHWVLRKRDDAGNDFHLQGLANMSQYMQADLPDGVYNHPIATGIENYCLRIINNAIDVDKSE